MCSCLRVSHGLSLWFMFPRLESSTPLVYDDDPVTGYASQCSVLVTVPVFPYMSFMFIIPAVVFWPSCSSLARDPRTLYLIGTLRGVGGGG